MAKKHDCLQCNTIEGRGTLLRAMEGHGILLRAIEGHGTSFIVF